MTLTGKLIVALIAGLIIAALVMVDTVDGDEPVTQPGVSVDIDTDRSKPRHNKPRQSTGGKHR